MEHDKTITIEDIKKIIKRRRWGLTIPAIAVFLISVVVIVVWTPVYRSASTILIEEQDVSRDYVISIMTSYADQRLQQINQRIMSAARLLDIINRFNLYQDKRNRWTTEEIVENMRKKDIKFETITADVIDPRTGRPATATIAFNVSYEGTNPAVVLQVANVLASLYLEENLRFVAQQTGGTTKFLEEEMKAVKARLTELEKDIADYKEKNPRALPELLQFNLQVMDSNDKYHDQLNDQLRTLRERESYLQTELATVVPDTKNQEKDRLKELRVTLGSLRARFSEEYPDVIKTKAEIAEIEKRLKHNGGQKAVEEKPDSPAYIALSAQLAGVQSEIKSMQRQVENLARKRDDYRRRLEMSPRVEEGYKKLLVERNNTQAKYDDLMKKFMDAKVAHGLEKGQMGERFTLIDPAKLPEKPVRPNRPVILFIGLILGIGAGVGTAALQEGTDRSARRPEDLSAVFSYPVLAEIPEIVTLQDEQRHRRFIRIMSGAVVLSLVILVLIVHFFVMDFDVLWARATRYLAF